MNAAFDFLQQPWTQRLGWTLVHFVWQGALLAAFFALARRVLRTASANARYVAGCGTLLLMLAVLAFTFVRQEPTAAYAPAIPGANQVASSPGQENNAPAKIISVNALSLKHPQTRSTLPALLHQLPEKLAKRMPWFVAAWFAGVVILSLRLFTGWLKILSLRSRHTQAADARWLEKLQQLKRRLGITRPVRLLQSVAVEVPTAIGWLCPVILLPASSLFGLTPAQVESILAHELAHIRRHDYLINLLQCLAETLLFYHPAVWWVSQCIRTERENCCDDLAVQLCGDPLTYAQALATLEELRSTPGALAMAANGKPLLQRIRRLLLPNMQAPKTKWTPSSASFLGILLVMLALFALPHAHSQKRDTAEMNSSTNLIASSTATNALGTKLSELETMRKLDATVLEQVSFDAPLSEVLWQLQRELEKQNPNGPEIKFTFAKSSAPSTFDLRATLIKIQPVLRNITVSQLLKEIVKVAEHPIQYSIGEGRVVFFDGNPDIKALHTRTFKVDPVAFASEIEKKAAALPMRTYQQNAAAAADEKTGLPMRRNSLRIKNSPGAEKGIGTNGFFLALQDVLEDIGIDVNAPGRNLFYKDRMGMLMLRGTLEELDKVENFMQTLNQHAPQL